MTTKVETDHRMQWAFTQLLLCRSHSAIVSELADTEGLSRRQARRYVGTPEKENCGLLKCG